MTLTETRSELVAAVERAKLNLPLIRAEAMLCGFDLAAGAHTASAAASRAALRPKVIAQLSNVPQTLEAIRSATRGRERDVEHILTHAPHEARWTERGWIRVEERQSLQEAAE